LKRNDMGVGSAVLGRIWLLLISWYICPIQYYHVTACPKPTYRYHFIKMAKMAIISIKKGTSL
jgi:hypothetical protein